MTTHSKPGQLIEQIPNVPIMSRELFACLTGFSEGVITGWINRGYIPTFDIGRYSAINLELLRKMCLDKEFRL